MADQTNPAPPSPAPSPSVGKLKIHLQRIAETDEAKVTLEVLQGNSSGDHKERIFLLGIRVKRAHQNWIQLTLPDPQTWEQPLKRLPQALVDRIHTAEFYETIRQQISQRYLALT